MKIYLYLFKITNKLQGALVFSAVILLPVLMLYSITLSHTIRTDSQILQSEKDNNTQAVEAKETIQLSSQSQADNLEVTTSNRSPQPQSVEDSDYSQQAEPQQSNQVQPSVEETQTAELQIAIPISELDNQPIPSSSQSQQANSQQNQSRRQATNYYAGNSGSSQQKPSSFQGKSTNEPQQTPEENPQPINTNQQPNTEDSDSDQQVVVINEPESQPAPLKVAAAEEEIPPPQNSQPTQQADTLDPQYASQNSNPSREERLAEGKQMLQEMKSILAELRQDLDEAKAFVNTLDNKAPYTEMLKNAEKTLVWQETRTIPSTEAKINSIRINLSHEPAFQQLKDLYDALRNTHTPAVNSFLEPIFNVKEWGSKLQEIREMSAQINDDVAEAKEFVKKWDKVPAVYAEAIKETERYVRWFGNTNYADKNYEILKNDPTNVIAREALQSSYNSFTTNLPNFEDLLETLLATARQPSVVDQCSRPGVTCEWHSGDNYMTKSKYSYTMSDGTDVVIKYFPSGEIQQYNEYHPYSSQKSVEINYWNPDTVCVDRQSNKTPWGAWCRAHVQSEKSWYSGGQQARETTYHSPHIVARKIRYVSDQAWREDGTQVFNIYTFEGTHYSDNAPVSGYYTYPDNSRKSTYSGGTLTCYEDGTGSTQGSAEPCTPFHTFPEY